MSSLQGFRAAYTTLGPAGSLATIAGAIAVVVVGASLWSFGRALMTTAPNTNSSNAVAKGSEAQDAAFKGYLAQIDGRSLFLVPGAPAKEPEVVAEEPKGPPPPPPPPTEYGGSALIAMVLDTVWFEDGRKMKVGDPAKDDTEVLSVKAPWEAELKWKGEKFMVPLFGRDKVVLKKEAGSVIPAVKTSTGSSSEATTSKASESTDKKPQAVAGESNSGGNGSTQATVAASTDSADASKKSESAAKPIGEKVVGPANSPSQEPEHPQVVVNKPPPGEKPTPPPGGIPPPPPPPDAPKN